MTLVVALACTDGVILASDSQGTEETGSVRFPTDKVFPLTESAVWGASGLGQIVREVREAFETSRDHITIWPDMAQSLIGLIRPIVTKHYSMYIPNVPGMRPSSPATYVLAGGCSAAGEPWILEIDARCGYTYYEERGFHAIGSGAGFAQMAIALMKHFDVRTRSVQQGKMIAYRVMRAAIDTSAFLLGDPIQMWVARHQDVTRVPELELAEVEGNVGAWEAMEAELLDRMAGYAAEPEAPMPPEIDA